MKVFITGGAGFIGSHCAAELMQKGHDVIIFDTYQNSNPEVTYIA